MIQIEKSAIINLMTKQKEKLRNKIRKEKTEQLFAQNRTMKFLNESETNKIEIIHEKNTSFKILFDDYVEKMYNVATQEQLLEAVKELKKLFINKDYINNKEFTNLSVSSKLIQIIIEFCDKKYDNLPALQFESSWILLNFLTSGNEQATFCLKNNILQKYELLLNSENSGIREHVIWGLANLCPNFEKRDYIDNDEREIILYIFNTQIIEALISVYLQFSSFSATFMEFTVKFFYFLSISNFKATFNKYENMLNIIEFIFSKTENTDLKMQCVSTTLSICLKFTTEEEIEILFNSAISFFQKLINILSISNEKENFKEIIPKILQICKKFSEGNLSTIVLLLKSDILQGFENLFNQIISEKSQQEICWILSNICSTDDTEDYIFPTVFEKKTLLIHIINISKSDFLDFLTRREALHFICDFIYMCNDDDMIMFFLNYGVLKILIQKLTLIGEETLHKILDAMMVIVSLAKTIKINEISSTFPDFMKNIYANEVYKLLYNLLDHEDEEIKNNSEKLIVELENYFDDVF